MQYASPRVQRVPVTQSHEDGRIGVKSRKD